VRKDGAGGPGGTTLLKGAEAAALEQHCPAMLRWIQGAVKRTVGSKAHQDIPSDQVVPEKWPTDSYERPGISHYIPASPARRKPLQRAFPAQVVLTLSMP